MKTVIKMAEFKVSLGPFVKADFSAFSFHLLHQFILRRKDLTNQRQLVLCLQMKWLRFEIDPGFFYLSLNGKDQLYLWRKVRVILKILFFFVRNPFIEV